MYFIQIFRLRLENQLLYDVRTCNLHHGTNMLSNYHDLDGVPLAFNAAFWTGDVGDEEKSDDSVEAGAGAAADSKEARSRMTAP